MWPDWSNEPLFLSQTLLQDDLWANLQLVGFGLAIWSLETVTHTLIGPLKYLNLVSCWKSVDIFLFFEPLVDN